VRISRVLRPVLDQFKVRISGEVLALDASPRPADKALSMLRSLSGASIRRVVDRSHARIPEHAHDWPVLSIFVLGRYSNTTELGETLITGPSAILYGAGAAHSNIVGPAGFEQIEIEFDPAWLGGSLIPEGSVCRWVGGRLAAEARTLARLCMQELEEEHLREVLRRLMRETSRDPLQIPRWVEETSARLCEDTNLRVADLAGEMRLHPSWFGTAYKRATGEGPMETAARFRLERAAWLLRETDQSPASIAAEAGFCDQSHMSRTFRRVLGRLPSEIRADRSDFRLCLADAS
jgi:AraC family transcriptional regulator